MPNLGACTQGSFAAVMRFSAYSSVIRRCLAAPHDSRESTSKPTVKLWSAKGLPLGRQFRTVRDSFPSYGSSHIHIRGQRNSTSFEHDLHLFFRSIYAHRSRTLRPYPPKGEVASDEQPGRGLSTFKRAGSTRLRGEAAGIQYKMTL